MAERCKTSLAQQAEDKDLARVICAGCHGYGSSPEALQCAFCAGSPAGLCLQHRCSYCLGMGVTCPECRGMRMLTRGMGQMHQTSATREHATMVNTALGFCQHCMLPDADGHMLVNLPKQIETIRAYVANPHTVYWDMRHQADAEKAAYEQLMSETKPWRRDYTSQKSYAQVEDRKRRAEAAALNTIVPFPQRSIRHA